MYLQGVTSISIISNMLNNTQCCGVKELHGLDRINDDNIIAYVYLILSEFNLQDTPYTEDDDTLEDWKSNLGAITFTYVVGRGYGPLFTNYIRDNHLGELTLSPQFINPNTDNQVVAGIFVPDRDRCRDWFEDNTV